LQKSAAVSDRRQRLSELTYNRSGTAASYAGGRGVTSEFGLGSSRENCAPWDDHLELRTYIVEDNATIRENLIGTLEELAAVRALGWSDSEADAKRWLQSQEGAWDLAIIDLFLKQGSGIGVLEAVRARAVQQRVVVLTNYATADMRKRCAQLGADAVFDKSNEIDALVDYCLQLSELGRQRL